MTPIPRCRILVISSRDSLRERIVAVLSERYDVKSCPKRPPADLFEDSALAVIDERDRAIGAQSRDPWPVVIVREAFEPDELLERVETRLELARLRRREREQPLIMDTVGAMIWFKDASNRILHCNRAAARWAGKSPDQIEGRLADEIFPAARARAYHQNDLDVIAAGCPKVGELEEIRIRGGSKRWVQRDTIPYRDDRGVIVGVVIVAVDVTALKRAENLAAAKERAEREFIANVSHEFRTPVSAIKGFAQTLRAGAWKEEGDRERFFRIIESNADRLDALVGDLITLSAIEGAAPPKAAAIALRPLALECAKKMVARARCRGVALGVSVPRGLRIAMDRSHLAQALEHLLDNAVKFTPPGGEVRIRGRGLGKRTKVWVDDNGIGIPHAELPRVFDRFFRVAKGAAPGNPGLGLHLVKKLVESYGGSGSVKSRIALGSSFCLTLPLARLNNRRRRTGLGIRVSPSTGIPSRTAPVPPS
jgi:two-component system phosphate regulon sensor histidine kinase PhoR